MLVFPKILRTYQMNDPQVTCLFSLNDRCIYDPTKHVSSSLYAFLYFSLDGVLNNTFVHGVQHLKTVRQLFLLADLFKYV